MCGANCPTSVRLMIVIITRRGHVVDVVVAVVTVVGVVAVVDAVPSVMVYSRYLPLMSSRFNSKFRKVNTVF